MNALTHIRKNLRRNVRKYHALAFAGLLGTLGVRAGAADLSWLDQPLKKPLNQVLIGITQNNAGVDSYQTLYEQAFKDYANEIGVRTIVLDAQGDPARQMSQIQNLTTQKVDALIVWPTNAKAVVAQVCRAKRAGIPVMVTDTPIDETGEGCIDSFVGVDRDKQGLLAGEMLIEAMQGKGNVVVINGLPGYLASTYRERGFMTAISGYPDMKVIDAQPADWNREKAQRLMENYITKYGSAINGVFASDDNMGAGALAAIRAAGFKPGEIKIVGATLFAAGYDAIKTGEYVGSVFQSPHIGARETVRVAVRLALGQTVDKKHYFDNPPVSPANIDQLARPDF